MEESILTLTEKLIAKVQKLRFIQWLSEGVGKLMICRAVHEFDLLISDKLPQKAQLHFIMPRSAHMTQTQRVHGHYMLNYLQQPSEELLVHTPSLLI